VRALQEAVGILEKLAGAYQKAKPVAQVRRDNGAAEERAVRAAMQENFVKLTSIADKVALVAAVRSYLLRQGRVETLEDLRYAFDEAIDGLVYQLALPATKRKAQEVVAEAWAKFEEKRIELADTHATIVGRLAIAAERAQ
jgi:hypothetical protein